ncbi:MAG: xylulokinase [Paracoccaceae bacterium]|nr:xylulokinase [Paracoccaceae bacterium]
MFLGIDLGTSALKALLIDDDQRVVATATAHLETSRPSDGWSEQDPADWITACRTALSDLSTRHPGAMGGIRAIGLSGQMHGATLVDDLDQPLRPAILWNDVRSDAEARALDAMSFMRDVTGSIVFPGFTAPKLNWVRRHEPEIFCRVERVLLPKDFLRLWLTGESVSDMSDASGTSWLDVRHRRWSEAALAATGLFPANMPRLVEGSDPGGALRPDVAREFGIPDSIPVAGGGGDNAASAIGTGVVSEGDALISLGTSGVLFVACDRFRPKPESAVHTFCHALPGRWHQMGVILAAMDSMNWLARVLGTPAEGLVDSIGRGATLRPPGTLRFLPYLGGERTPHNDARIRAGFIGLSHGDDRDSLVQAVLEGIAFAFRDCQVALGESGTRISRCLAVGGGARSDYLLALLSTALGLPLDRAETGDFGGAFGAARLAMLALGDTTEESVCVRPPVARTFEPVTALTEEFDAAYADYRALYPQLAGR